MLLFIITGYYCDAQGLTAPTGLCAPGYYCETGSDNDSPVECPAGKYCPEGKNVNICNFKIKIKSGFFMRNASKAFCFDSYKQENKERKNKAVGIW